MTFPFCGVSYVKAIFLDRLVPPGTGTVVTRERSLIYDAPMQFCNTHEFEKSKVLLQLRERQAFIKPSVRRRGAVLKAVYKQKIVSGKIES